MNTFNGYDYDKKCYMNAHLTYKDYSIIVDYERELHWYCEVPENTVPVEIWKGSGDIDVFYAKYGDKWKEKVDLSEIISHIDSYEKEEPKD